jgi:UDP-N-acetylmuramate-alanine ligase
MRVIFLVLLLAACDASPAPQMMGARKVNVTVDGRGYTVWRKGTAFEVVRHGWASPGQHKAVEATMLAVVAQVTGCTPKVERGDSAEIRGTLTACK